MGLYLDSGYLNQKWIYEQAKQINAAFIVELGARQVGKTYGTLQLALQKKTPFILMRRSKNEADFISQGAVNPFLALGETDIYTKKQSEYTGGIFKNDEQIGLIMSLNSVAKTRGFYGGAYTDLIYDEFIPENHVIKIRNEGDAFLNAIVTISGNRELEGQPPLLTWLLSNSNNISSPILAALNLTDKIESMINRGQEFSALADRGIVIVMPKSEKVLNQRKQNAIVKAAGTESQFYQMAFENRFSYNDAENVKAKPLKEYRPLFTVDKKFTVYKHKDTMQLYVTPFKKCSGKVFSDSQRGIREMLLYYPDLKVLYTTGKTYFQNLTIKQIYTECIKI